MVTKRRRTSTNDNTFIKIKTEDLLFKNSQTTGPLFDNNPSTFASFVIASCSTTGATLHKLNFINLFALDLHNNFIKFDEMEGQLLYDFLSSIPLLPRTALLQSLENIPGRLFLIITRH